MIKKIAFSSLFILAIITSITLINTSAFAQSPLLVEDFTYPAASLLTANNWAAHSGEGTNSIATTSPGLTLTGYPSSGIGNAASMTVSGEDVNRAYPVQSSGAVYAGFLVNVSEAAVDPIGGYFFHLSPDPIGTNFRGRVFIKKDASNNIAFGISKAGTNDTSVGFTPFSYALNTTYLVVVKYAIVDGATNDTVSLFVSTTTPATEPAATVSALDVTATDINPGTVALRQGATATSPTVRVDGIRIGTTWASITQASAPAPVQHVVDFDGDGKTDYSVVRNTGVGTTNQFTWFYNPSSGSGVQAFAWGISSDYIVPADYDGDNKTDIAVWREAAQGTFYILQSNGFTVRTVAFGQNGDNPRVVGDYDGDGKDDVAVYRAGASAGSPSTWYYLGSLNNPSGNITFVRWGINGDFPVSGDYNGDGKNDFVIQRDANNGGQANFWILNSAGGNSVTTFGTPTDRIVPGDYDGDGKTDLAVVRSSGGSFNWYYLPSSGGVFQQFIFGLSTDSVVQGDYDGDGRTDIAVWRNGIFYVRQSSNASLATYGLGSTGDIPVANSYAF
jgi:hypothetical protein